MTRFYTFPWKKKFYFRDERLKIRMTCFTGPIVLEEDNDVDKNKTVD